MNEELRLAWEFVEHTGRSIFLTGKAGTGKTTFLKHVVANSTKRAIVVAPTGVAAINAGGATIHSFFQLPLSPFVPDTWVNSKYNFNDAKRKIVRSLDLLIIDEISMVRSDLLDAVDQALQRYRGNGLPFGGVQLLMIGDLQQLTPVVKRDEEQLLSTYYDTPYFFGSKALSRIEYVTIELKTIFRQQDSTFIGILNKIREGKAGESDLRELNKRYHPSFEPRPEEGYIRLTTHNHRADSYNNNELAKLQPRSHVSRAVIEGTFPEYLYPTSTNLELKVGAQVMFIKNDTAAEHRYYNGRIGHVSSIDDDGDIYVLCPGDDCSIKVEPMTWENSTYTLNSETRELESKVQGTFRQLPLRLAWAITIHKSQGLTFNKAIIEADASFASGQVYVALSRCRTLEGLVLAAPIYPHNIINDRRVEDYINGQETAAARSISSLPTLKEEFYRAQLIELFSFGEVFKCQGYLSRQLSEFFSNKFPMLTDKHKELSVSMKNDIGDVSLKWATIIRSMSTEELHGEAFLERVGRGCEYFEKKLSEALEMPVRRCKDVKSNNKEAMKRFNKALTDLSIAYLTKLNILRFINTEGFSTVNYLKHKQKAIVMAMEGSVVKKSGGEVLSDMIKNTVNKLTGKKNTNTVGAHSGGRPQKEKQKKEKPTNKEEPKNESSKEISYRMFCEGKSLKQIAKERDFAEATIAEHLTYYVGLGKADVNRLVSAETLAFINRVVEVIGKDAGIREIRDLCPERITYMDIKLVLASMKSSKESR